MKIVTVTSEIAPFSKSGGLADVTRSLSCSLKKLGNEIIVVTPLYGKIIDRAKHNLELVYKNIKVNLDAETAVEVNIWKSYLADGLPAYFIENKRYFSRRKQLYCSAHENVRFLLFNLACLELVKKLNFQPDIIHCHDWQAGLIPYFLKHNCRVKRSDISNNVKTVFTIHNIIFQLGRNWWEIPLNKKDYGKKKLPLVSDSNIEYINFTKRAIMSADIINTVSEQYKKEIMTRNIGQDLHRILRNRQSKLFGIVNGIDYKSYNPVTDKRLFKRYSYRKIHRKKLNKQYLQEKFGLPIDYKIPIICTTSRVTFQKGFELILKILEHLMPIDLQFIVIGAGDKSYIQKLKKIAKKYPKKLVIVPSHEKNQEYETLVYAGSDFFLLPSHHEPCGINQLIAMRYGCIPIVRQTGGLHNTVENFDPQENKGTGFAFHRFSEFSLYGAIIRALEVYKQKYIFRSIMARAMKQSSSWAIPAKKYMALYKKITNY